MGLGTELLMAARKLFVDEKVDVAVVWTRKENETAVKLYKKAGFNETTQLIMSFFPSRAKNI